MHNHHPAPHDVVIAGAGPVGLLLACELRLVPSQLETPASRPGNIVAIDQRVEAATGITSFSGTSPTLLLVVESRETFRRRIKWPLQRRRATF